MRTQVRVSLALIGLLALAGCGGSSSSGSTAVTPSAVARCLRQGGAEVTRQRAEITAGYYEIAAVAHDRGIIRILLVKHPANAHFINGQLEFELEQIRGLGAVLTKAIDHGRAVIGVAPTSLAAARHPATAPVLFPSAVDEELATKCAGRS